MSLKCEPAWQMALKWVQRAQPFAAIARRCPTQSTWSIDLAYLLQVPLNPGP